MLKPRKLFFWNNNDINPINYGFKKGFSAPRKSGNNTCAEKQKTKNNNKRKKTRKRKTFANQLLTRYPPFAPLAQVDE